MIENTEKIISGNDDNKMVQKPKRKLTEKQIEIGKANLEKGRVALAEKKRRKKKKKHKK